MADKPFPDPEVLPPEDDEEGEEEEAPRRSSGLGPNPGVRRRRRRRKQDEKEDDEELTERALLIKIIGKDARMGEILALFDKARHREGSRRSDFENSQRAFIFQMGLQNEKLMEHVERLLEKNLGFLAKFDELYQKNQEGQSSKAKEVVEVGAIILATPIGQAIQEEALVWMKERREKRTRKIQAENDWLRRRLAQMEAASNAKKEEEKP